MRASLLDELDASPSSRNGRAHLREVIVGVRDTGEDISRRMSGFSLAAASSELLPYPQRPHRNLHGMSEITVLYFAAATTATNHTSETFAIPDDGLKLSDLAKLIISRHPNSGIDRVLEQSRWSVDAELVDRLDTFVLRGGEEVAVIPPVSGG